MVLYRSTPERRKHPLHQQPQQTVPKEPPHGPPRQERDPRTPSTRPCPPFEIHANKQQPQENVLLSTTVAKETLSQQIPPDIIRKCFVKRDPHLISPWSRPPFEIYANKQQPQEIVLSPITVAKETPTRQIPPDMVRKCSINAYFRTCRLGKTEATAIQRYFLKKRRERHEEPERAPFSNYAISLLTYISKLERRDSLRMLTRGGGAVSKSRIIRNIPVKEVDIRKTRPSPSKKKNAFR